MTLSTIKEKLHQYLENGDPKKVKAFYNLVEDEISADELWSKEYVEELDKRTYEMENDLAKTYSWEEVVHHLQSKRRKLKK